MRSVRRTRVISAAVLLSATALTAATFQAPEGQPVSTGSAELVSVDADGQAFTDGATGPAISALGDRVSFSNFALAGLPLMFVRDRVESTTEGQLLGADKVAMSRDGCVIVGTFDTQHSIWNVCTNQIWSAPQFDNYQAAKPAVSADGGVVVVPSVNSLLLLRRADGYSSTAPDKVFIPTEFYDAYFENATEVGASDDATWLATVVQQGTSILRFRGSPALGTTPNQGLYFGGQTVPMTLIAESPVIGSPSMDGAGNWLAFHDAEGVKAYERATGQTSTLIPGGRDPSLSRDGRHLSYIDPGSNDQVYVLTRLGPTWTAATETQWMSAGPGVVSNLVSANPVVSEHGRWVAWATSDIGSIGLTGGPTDGTLSVVVRERRPVLDVAGHDFGTVEAPASVNVPITNSGPSGWRVTSLGVAGPFTLASHNCPSVLHPGEACRANVGFDAAAIGDSNGSVLIRDDSYPGIPVVAVGSLAASVPEPVPPPDFGMAFTQNPVDFGTVLIGQTTASQVISLGNTGSDTLTVGVVEPTSANASDFSIADDQCSGRSLAANATCLVEVTFTPGAVGPRFAVLSATGSGGTSATTRLIGRAETPDDPDNGTPPPAVTRFFPTLSVSPDATPTGSVVAVAGRDYPPFATVDISLGDAPPIEVTSDGDGAFDIHWLIIDGVPQGTYAIDDVATDIYDAAAVDVLVVATPMRPQGARDNPRFTRRHVSR